MNSDSKQMYIASPWDNQLYPVTDELQEHITLDKLKIVKQDRSCTTYSFIHEEKEYTLFYCLPDYAIYRNRLTDFSYLVELFINGIYVKAKPHQIEALMKYVVTKNPNIEVPHPNGGMFRAIFSTIDNNNFQYITEDDHIVQMRRTAVV